MYLNIIHLLETKIMIPILFILNLLLEKQKKKLAKSAIEQHVRNADSKGRALAEASTAPISRRRMIFFPLGLVVYFARFSYRSRPTVTLSVLRESHVQQQ